MRTTSMNSNTYKDLVKGGNGLSINPSPLPECLLRCTNFRSIVFLNTIAPQKEQSPEQMDWLPVLWTNKKIDATSADQLFPKNRDLPGREAKRPAKVTIMFT